MEIERIVLAAVPLLLGIGFVAFRVQKIVAALKECADVLTSIVSAFGDSALTKEEIAEIKKQGIEAISALKAIFK